MTIRNEKALKNMPKISDKVLKAVEVATNEFGKDMEVNIVRQIRLLNLVWTKNLLNSVNWVKRAKGGQLKMAGYADELDSGGVRIIRANTSSRLWSWALGGRFGPAKKGVAESVKRKLRAGKSVTVHQHPFILQPVNLALARFPKILQLRVERAVKEGVR